MLRWNAVIILWYRCTLPIFVLDDYIWLRFSCTVHKPTIFWPNSCISYVLTYILFFFCSPIPYFFFCIAVSLPHFILLPVCSPSLSLSFPKCPPPCPAFSFISLVCVFIPCLHSLCSCFCAWTNVPRTNLPQLTALNHDPWPPHHSAGTTLRYGWSVHLRSSSTLLSSCLTLLALLSF